MYIWHFLQKKCWLFTIPRGEQEHSSEHRCWKNAMYSENPGPSPLTLLALFDNFDWFIFRSSLCVICGYIRCYISHWLWSKRHQWVIQVQSYLSKPVRYLNTFTAFINYRMGKSIRKLIISFLCKFGKHNVHGTTQYWFHRRFGQTQESKGFWCLCYTRDPLYCAKPTKEAMEV